MLAITSGKMKLCTDMQVMFDDVAKCPEKVTILYELDANKNLLFFIRNQPSTSIFLFQMYLNESD